MAIQNGKCGHLLPNLQLVEAGAEVELAEAGAEVVLGGELLVQGEAQVVGWWRR